MGTGESFTAYQEYTVTAFNSFYTFKALSPSDAAFQMIDLLALGDEETRVRVTDGFAVDMEFDIVPVLKHKIVPVK